MNRVRIIIAILASALIATALWHLKAAERGIIVTPLEIAGIPVTLYQAENGGRNPVVLIAHGFAGSQQLMQSFAFAFARNGYAAVTFDFSGHGRNPRRMTGDIDLVDGATRRLVGDVAAVAAEARLLGDGRMAVLGHSMASDIIVRFAESNPYVMATVAVSMFSPAVTASSPRNLLIIAGEWEDMLKREALRAVGLAIAPRQPEPGVTYGDFTTGTARRAAFIPHAEHVSVLFNEQTLRESLSWLDRSFGTVRAETPQIDGRGLWIMALFAGTVLLGWPLSSLLPRVSPHPEGAGLGWPQIWPGVVIPMVATPFILRILPTHFLPILVGDYLASHFLLYGIITVSWLYYHHGRGRLRPLPIHLTRNTLVALLAVIGYGFLALVLPLDEFVTSFIPLGIRPTLIAVLLAGTSIYFLSDEWLTRGAGAAPGATIVTKAAFLLSLGFAVLLDPQRLFFLVLIVPVMVPFFIVYGFFSSWVYARTRQPFIAGLASALAFAWAIGVTFPLVTG